MAPKKDKKKKDAVEAEPEVLSLYAKREPLPPSEPGSAAEAEGAWKACRGHFLPSLLEWDAAAVNTTEWLSPSGEPFAGGNFSAQALPKTLLAHVTSWRRLSAPTDGSAPLEEEPRAQPFPEVEDSARDADGGKDKAAASAKAKAQPAAKGGKKDDLSSARDTAKQFADLEARRASGTVPETDMCVVSDAEFKNRETALSHDEALPPVSQSIAAQMALIAEHREMLPKGSFLWELIHPQDSDGKPIYNPQGKYIVRLFAQGEWRQVLIDDVVPVGVAGAGQTAPVFPSSPLQNVIWPQLLTKAIFRAFQAELGQRGELPVVTALTGWLPFQQAPLTWDAIKSAFAYRPFCCLQATSKPDPEARQRDALMVASAQVQGQLSGRGATVVPPLAIPAQGSAAPRLSGPLLEAPLQFLVCQLGEEPQQVRLKSGHWRPRGGSPRKYVLRDGQVEHEDDDLGAEEDEDTNDEDEPLDEGDEDDDAKSGDEALASARSQAEVAQDAAAEQALEQEAQGSEPAEQPPPTWPESLPAPAMLRSEADAYHGTLAAGHWVTFDQLRQSCDSLVTYMPPGERMLKSCLDSRWASDRRQPFCPPPLHVMRLRLTPMTRQQDEEEPAEGAGAEPASDPPPWCRVLLCYEPLRLDPIALSAAGGKQLAAGPGGGVSTCLLQHMGRWEAPGAGAEALPDFIHLVAGDGKLGATTRCCTLPPGEHLYLVLDDAARAGSALSVFVDGSRLDLERSVVEFVELPTLFQESQVPTHIVPPAEYPVQDGFSIWTKAEVLLWGEELAAQCLEIITHLTDTSLYQHLTLTILRLQQGGAVTQLLRSPLLRLLSLPLGPVCEAASGGDGQAVKCVLMLEADVPSPAPAGALSMHLALPHREMPDADQREGMEPLPIEEPPKEEPPKEEAKSVKPKKSGKPSPEDLKRSSVESEAPMECPRKPLALRGLKTDSVLRWSGETAPNDHNLVLCERITVAAGAGEVTACLRVLLSGLNGAALRVQLVAQAPPAEEMRPKVKGDAEGEWKDPEPLQAGAKVDPKQYGGRNNWLKCCRTVLEETSKGTVLLPHVVLADGSTHLLYVYLDLYRGPGNLEGGTWTLEFFGSGAVEVGADTMEADLEALVRRSWEESPPPDDGRPPRKERAKKSRDAWLRANGRMPCVEVDELQDAPTPATEGAGPEPGSRKPSRSAAPKGASPPSPTPQSPTPSPEALSEAASKAAEELAAAKLRQAARQHSNDEVAKFVLDVTKVGAALVTEDPYTVAPERPPVSAAEQVEGAEVAVLALGSAGAEEARKAEVEAASSYWAEAKAQIAAAKERNAQAVAGIAAWRQEFAPAPRCDWAEDREALRGGLQQRVNKQAALRDVVGNAELEDSLKLRGALQEANEAQVGTWDPELVEAATEKAEFLEALGPFKATLAEESAKAEEERLADPSARRAFAEQLATVQGLLGKLQAKKVPLSPEASDPELTGRAVTLLRELEAGEAPVEPSPSGQ